jgi:peptidoglycan/LPS O-acetylase OafA/YrhL
MAAVPRKSEKVAMAKSITIEDRMQSAGGAMTGFDYLRIALSVAVLCWHSIRNSTGSIELDHALWSGSCRFLPAAIIPTFFALSGFLVAGSLDRTRLVPFMTLRFLRLVPALAVEITLSALILGLIFTTLPRSQYLTHEQFYSYFLNIVGSVQYRLPGVFETNPDGGTVNAQLWTIPFELECYFALVLLSLSTLVRRRLAFISVAFGLSLALTVWTLLGHPADPTTHIPGRALVLSFLAAVSLYLYRGVIPYSNVVGVLSAIAAAALLEIPDAAYLAAFPVAYMTVWIGLMRPPAIPFGDLSYGIYLFHFPIEQTVMHMFPGVRTWWMLTLVTLPFATICAWLSWNLIEKPILTRKKAIVAIVDQAWTAMPTLSHLAPWSIKPNILFDRDMAAKSARRVAANSVLLPIGSRIESARESVDAPFVAQDERRGRCAGPAPAPTKLAKI